MSETIEVKERYVSEVVAKLLQERGFTQRCAKYYLDGKRYDHHHTEVIPKDAVIYECPTQQMAMDFLRKKYGLFISLKVCRLPFGYKFSVIKLNKTVWHDKDFAFVYGCPEVAINVALNHCLSELK